MLRPLSKTIPIIVVILAALAIGCGGNNRSDTFGSGPDYGPVIGGGGNSGSASSGSPGGASTGGGQPVDDQASTSTGTTTGTTGLTGGG